MDLRFSAGSGAFLARDATVDDGIAIDELELVIPDPEFPIALRGGHRQLRHHRCGVRRAEVRFPESSLERLLETAAQPGDFTDPSLELTGGEVHFAASRPTQNASATMVAASATLEGTGPSDRLHLRFQTFDGFGPRTRSARRLVADAIDEIAARYAPPGLESGRGPIARSGASVVVRPLYLLFLHQFATAGWKLPDLSNTAVSTNLHAELEVRAEARDEAPNVEPSSAPRGAENPLQRIDDLAAEGETEPALDLLDERIDEEGPDAERVERLIDLRLADPTPDAIDRADDRLRDLDSPPPHLAGRIEVARARPESRDLRAAHERLADTLEQSDRRFEAEHVRRLATRNSEDRRSSEPAADADLRAFRERHRELLENRAPDHHRPREGNRTSASQPGPPDPSSEDELWSRIDDTRTDRSPGDRADLLERAVQTWRSAPDAAPVSEDRYTEYLRELVELTYVDLDEPDRALPHLERLRMREDPPDELVLNALESIYRDRGDVEALVELLEARRRRTDSPETEATFGVLIAEALWQQRADAEAARERLAPLLEPSSGHVGAHRLAARIALDDDEPERAREHLARLADGEDAGLETLSAERRLARLLLERLDRPARARTRFESVLRDAPYDREALRGLEVALFQLGDWEAYVDCLVRQIGIAAGDPESVEERGLAAVDPESVSSSERRELARTCADAARIADTELEADRRARRLWSLAHALEPENPAFVDELVDLTRRLGEDDLLVDALQDRADLILETDESARQRLEAARIALNRLDEPDRAADVIGPVADAAGRGDLSEELQADFESLQSGIGESPQ